MTSSISKQKGTFAIEFSIVAFVFAAVITFSMDVAVKLSDKGKIDRLSHSLVNVVRERTQLYAGVEQPSDADADQIYQIAVASLEDSIPQFDPNKLGVNIDSGFYDDTENFVSLKRGGVECGVPHSKQDFINHTVLKEDGTYHPIYNVNICYSINNIFSVGEFGKTTTIESESWAVGR
ncbi:tight adherence pilus pseudopilin TadF [Vibrio owensii]|uniref:tight adherence pilus pseudopilin TadF n=1 Tax=Vibrio owensii TaxID=696485 RepID=UPI003AB0DB9F